MVLTRLYLLLINVNTGSSATFLRVTGLVTRKIGQSI